MADNAMQKWLEDRNYAILSMDFERFKSWAMRAHDLAGYKGIPSDEIILESMYRMLLMLMQAEDWKKKAAVKWLLEHGKIVSKEEWELAYGKRKSRKAAIDTDW